MPTYAHAHVGMTWLVVLAQAGKPWLLRSERLGIPKFDWVGCAGLADMAGFPL